MFRHFIFNYLLIIVLLQTEMLIYSGEFTFGLKVSLMVVLFVVYLIFLRMYYKNIPVKELAKHVGMNAVLLLLLAGANILLIALFAYQAFGAVEFDSEQLMKLREEKEIYFLILNVGFMMTLSNSYTSYLQSKQDGLKKGGGK